MGLTDGVRNGQILGEQIGFRSRLLEQSACTEPFTQLHRQSAIAHVGKINNKTNIFFIRFSL